MKGFHMASEQTLEARLAKAAATLSDLAPQATGYTGPGTQPLDADMINFLSANAQMLEKAVDQLGESAAALSNEPTLPKKGMSSIDVIPPMQFAARLTRASGRLAAFAPLTRDRINPNNVAVLDGQTRALEAIVGRMGEHFAQQNQPASEPKDLGADKISF